MESYMFWQLSMCVGFLLALVVVILIAATVMVGVHLVKKLDADIARELWELEKYREVTSDDRDN